MQTLFPFTAAVLVLAVLFGGGTRQGFLGDSVVQLAACVLLIPALWMFIENKRWRRLDWASIAFLAVMAVLCIIQLVPFFPRLRLDYLVVPAIAGDGPTVGGFWGRVSLTPAASWAGIVASIVPFALFLAVMQCDVQARLQLWRLILALGLIALLLGLAQIFQGPDSHLRFFAVTNLTEAVGFFANRNHFAAQLYVTLAFAGAWIASAAQRVTWQKGIGGGPAVVSLAAAIALVLLVIAGLAVARSRAGMLIAIGIVFGIGLIVLRASNIGRSVASRRLTSRTLIAILSVSVLFVALLALQRIVDRFQQDVADDLRFPLARATLQAAWSALPFGTGIGSFPRVYAVIEDPANLVPAYVNHAHNDFAEFFLEAGLPALALITLFLVWFAGRTLAVWSVGGIGNDETYSNVARAASLAVAGLLLHAFVDYGLRTTALAALFAVACGFLTSPPRTKKRAAKESRAASMPPKRPRAPERPFVAPAVDSPPPQPAPWPKEMQWPKAWTSTDKPPSRREPHDRSQ